VVKVKFFLLKINVLEADFIGFMLDVEAFAVGLSWSLSSC
jgi:hypothetical protein